MVSELACVLKNGLTSQNLLSALPFFFFLLFFWWVAQVVSELTMHDWELQLLHRDGFVCELLPFWRWWHSIITFTFFELTNTMDVYISLMTVSTFSWRLARWVSSLFICMYSKPSFLFLHDYILSDLVASPHKLTYTFYFSIFLSPFHEIEF